MRNLAEYARHRSSTQITGTCYLITYPSCSLPPLPVRCAASACGHGSNAKTGFMPSTFQDENSDKAGKRAKAKVSNKSAPQLKPPLKWAGGKRRPASLIQPYWQPHKHRRFVELFCGGLAFTLGLRPQITFYGASEPERIADNLDEFFHFI